MFSHYVLSQLSRYILSLRFSYLLFSHRTFYFPSTLFCTIFFLCFWSCFLFSKKLKMKNGKCQRKSYQKMETMKKETEIKYDLRNYRQVAKRKTKTGKLRKGNPKLELKTNFLFVTKWAPICILSFYHLTNGNSPLSLSWSPHLIISRS